jgi:hypothetical protein
MKNLVIVSNLFRGQVTWSNSFISCAIKNGIEVVSEGDAADFSVNKIFIGDSIKKEPYTTQGKNIYFLGASSVSPSDYPTPEKINLEVENMKWSDLTIVVSRSEQDKVLGLDKRLKNKVKVMGFPIDFSRIRKYKKRNKKRRSVCFLGETRKIKNSEFELKLIKFLNQKRFDSFHLSPKKVGIKNELISLGCKVIEYITGDEYLKLLSSFDFFISTSFYESLSVSGIEAFFLGCKPIVPDHSGFMDWCPQGNRYKDFDEQLVFNTIQKVSGNESNDKILKWYSGEEFFKRVDSVILDMERTSK